MSFIILNLRRIEEERVAEAFDIMDSDANGFISRQNLRDFLGRSWTLERINELISEADVDRDGQSKFVLKRGRWEGGRRGMIFLLLLHKIVLFCIIVSYQEFLTLFRFQTNSMVMDSNTRRSVVSDFDETKLVGIDTLIPGGILDTEERGL